MEIVAELMIGDAGETQCCPGRDVASTVPWDAGGLTDMATELDMQEE